MYHEQHKANTALELLDYNSWVKSCHLPPSAYSPKASSVLSCKHLLQTDSFLAAIRWQRKLSLLVCDGWGTHAGWLACVCTAATSEARAIFKLYNVMFCVLFEKGEKNQTPNIWGFLYYLTWPGINSHQIYFAHSYRNTLFPVWLKY